MHNFLSRVQLNKNAQDKGLDIFLTATNSGSFDDDKDVSMCQLYNSQRMTVLPCNHCASYWQNHLRFLSLLQQKKKIVKKTPDRSARIPHVKGPAVLRSGRYRRIEVPPLHEPFRISTAQRQRNKSSKLLEAKFKQQQLVTKRAKKVLGISRVNAYE